MISRRGFFGMVAWLAASPLFGRPRATGSYSPAKHIRNTKFEPTLAHPALDPVEAKKMCGQYYNRIFVWSYTPGILRWPKNSDPEKFS